jgi:hypothetical protein
MDSVDGQGDGLRLKTRSTVVDFSRLGSQYKPVSFTLGSKNRPSISDFLAAIRMFEPLGPPRLLGEGFLSQAAIDLWRDRQIVSLHINAAETMARIS